MVEQRRDHDPWRITDELWAQIFPLLPPEPSHARGGRPRQPARLMMEGTLYVLVTGCKWKALPPRFGAPSTVYGHFHAWREAGVFRRMMEQGLLSAESYAELERRARRAAARHDDGARQEENGHPAARSTEPPADPASAPPAPVRGAGEMRSLV